MPGEETRVFLIHGQRHTVSQVCHKIFSTLGKTFTVKKNLDHCYSDRECQLHCRMSSPSGSPSHPISISCNICTGIKKLWTSYRPIFTNIANTLTEKLHFSSTFLLLKNHIPVRKAKCLFYSPDVKISRSAPSSSIFSFGKNSRRKRPTRFHVGEGPVACRKAHRLHASQTPLKHARVVGTRVSALGLCA